VDLDGSGNVLGGVEDIASTNYTDQADPILATVPGTVPNTSYYAVDVTGHVTLRMKTQNGQTLDVSLALTSASHGVVIEVGGDPGSGIIDLQQSPFSAVQIKGGYSFTLDGVDPAVPPVSRLAMGGMFTANGISSMSNGTLDIYTAGVNSGASFAGNFSAPDANGRGQLKIVPAGTTPTRTFVYYLVSPKVLRIVEDDGVDLMGGSAYAQGAAGATLAGDFVYRHSGWTGAGRTVAAGQFVATAAGNITAGVSDSNSGGKPPTTAHSGTAVSGNLNAPVSLDDAAGNSTFNVYVVDPTVNILDPSSTTGGGGALLLHTDANLTGTGVIVPQSLSSTPTFTGIYAVNLENSIAAAAQNELDLVGVMTSDGSARLANGLADYDQNNTAPVLGAALAAAFLRDATNLGHFTGSFSINATSGASSYPFIPGPGRNTSFNVSYYQASASQAFLIETDSQADIDGTLVLQQLP